eukprot:CAMPEP_0172607060 /NCGR_PEP_ID=MMETSP1068-20121228/27283_1 /TAXON_ID=35684 /ORGANISM="Pseudopedinella elastica, Strain CCMP716" /LENGTH=202 /DNA_ID=CAMNT_0013409987 /DNA_START=135 /DNA_END=743 /DNA_ORIENTATION=+
MRDPYALNSDGPMRDPYESKEGQGTSTLPELSLPPVSDHMQSPSPPETRRLESAPSVTKQPVLNAEPDDPKQLLMTYPVCGVIGFANAVHGAKLGGGFGLVFGTWDGVQAGLWRQPTLFVPHVVGRSLGSAFSFAGFLGVYNGTKCSIQVARGGTKDIFNAGAAGALAGSLGGLPSRNPVMIGGAAFVTGGLMMVLEGIGGH